MLHTRTYAITYIYVEGALFGTYVVRTVRTCACELKRFTMRIFALLVFCLLVATQSTAFLVAPKNDVHLAGGLSPLPTWKKGLNNQAQGLVQTTRLQGSRNQVVDGANRGYVLLGLVFLACVWIFSIPPEFRRMHFCTSPDCVQNRASCYDCVTVSEWTNSVAEYYKNGGGIQFDFSVDPATREIFEGKK